MRRLRPSSVRSAGLVITVIHSARNVAARSFTTVAAPTERLAGGAKRVGTVSRSRAERSFHSRKMPFRAYLLAIAIFCNEVKGKSMLALSRDLGTHYMTAFVLAHKMREAMASEMKGMNVGGEGRKAEIDGGYFGGYVFAAQEHDGRRLSAHGRPRE
jgi:hypothetical protein